MKDEMDKNNAIIDIETSDLDTTVDARDLLSSEERDALAAYEKDVLSKDPRRTLSPNTAIKLFQLFLNGYSTKEIQELNSTFPLGMIIHARVKYEWDLERDNHVKELMGRVREKVLLTQLESAHYLTDVMSAIHKLNGNKIKKYLQTGDKADLEGLHIETLTNYAKTFELVTRLTGQDRDRKGSTAPVQVIVPSGSFESPNGSSAPQAIASRTDKALSADDAASVVRALLEIRKTREDKNK